MEGKAQEDYLAKKLLRAKSVLKFDNQSTEDLFGIKYDLEQL